MCSLELALLGCSPKPGVGVWWEMGAWLGAFPGLDPLLCHPALWDGVGLLP